MTCRVAAWRKALARRSANHGHDPHRHHRSLDGKAVDWLEKVTDEQYLAA